MKKFREQKYQRNAEKKNTGNKQIIFNFDTLSKRVKWLIRHWLLQLFQCRFCCFSAFVSALKSMLSLRSAYYASAISNLGDYIFGVNFTVTLCQICGFLLMFNEEFIFLFSVSTKHIIWIPLKQWVAFKWKFLFFFIV